MTRRHAGAGALGLMLALGILALGALSASATTSGHFTSDAPSGTTILHMAGATGSSHDAELFAYGSAISCHNIEYSVNPVTTRTVTSLTVTAGFSNCTTDSGDTATVRMNGCHFQFTSRSTQHATVHFLCPEGKRAVVETSAGVMKFPPQTPTTGGLTFGTTVENGAHAVTVNVTAQGLHAECHGICQLLGTKTTTAQITGSGTVVGTDAVTKGPVDITAT
jgi:hypothetical protein